MPFISTTTCSFLTFCFAPFCCCCCCCCCTRHHKFLWWHRACNDEVGNDRDDLTILRIGVSFWTIFPHCFTINAGYTHHWRLFEVTICGRFFRKLWRRKHPTGACLKNASLENKWPISRKSHPTLRKAMEI